MTAESSMAWPMLLMLGIFHGINPGMGWLFAVGLGLQEQQRAAVWRSLLPLAAGHAFAIVAAVAVAGLFAQVVPLSALKWGVACVLVSFGMYRLFRQGHPRYGGMQVGSGQLAIWSFLMASAHGAGLMVLPFVFGSGVSASPAQAAVRHVAGSNAAGSNAAAAHAAGSHAAAAAAGHADHGGALLAALPAEPVTGLLVTLVHTAGYLLVMGLIAVVVYEKAGLRLLRAAWINIDVIWATALILTGLLTVML